MAEYTYRRAGLWAGVFNGEGQNVAANTDSTMLGVARLAVRLLPNLALGLNGALATSAIPPVTALMLPTRTTGLRSGASTGQRGTRARAPTTGGGTVRGCFRHTHGPGGGKYEESARPGVTTAVRNRA